MATFSKFLLDILRDCCNYELSVGCNIDSDNSDIVMVHIKMASFDDKFLSRIPVPFEVIGSSHCTCLRFELPYNFVYK